MLSLTTPALLRLVLACYLAVLGIASLSPVVQPPHMEMVCSADGTMKMVVVDHSASPHTLDCALCLAASLPAPESASAQAAPPPLAHALTPIVVAHVAARIGARFPPRGPPARA